MSQFKRIIVVLAIICFIMPGCASDEEKKAAHLNKGKHYFEKGDYKSAELEFKNVTQIDPEFVEGYLYLGKTALKLGIPRDAFRAYNMATRFDAENVEANSNLAKFYLLAKKTEESRKSVDLVLKKEPDNIDALLISAGIFFLEGEFEQTVGLFKRVIEIDNKEPRAYTGLASTYLRQNKFVEAETILKKLISLDSKVISPRMMLVKIYMGTSKFDKAEKEIKAIISHNPENADLYIALGSFYIKQKRIADAETAYLKSVELAPLNMRTYIALSGLYYNSGQRDKIPGLYAEALKNTPDSLVILDRLARYYYEEKNFEKAEKLIADILKKQANHFGALLLKGEILLSHKKLTEAVVIFDRLIKDNPESERAHYFKGVANFVTGQIGVAKTSILKALDLNPRNVKAKLLLAEIFFKERAYDMAGKEAAQVLNSFPDSFEANLISGNVSLAKGDIPMAEKAFNKLIKLAPENAEGYYRLGLAKQLLKKHNQALIHYQKAALLDPKRMDVFTNIIVLNVIQKQFSKALSVCDGQLVTMKEFPQHVSTIHNVKGGIYIALKDMQNAEKEFNIAIAVYPDNIKSYFALARIALSVQNEEKAIAQYKKAIERNPKQPEIHMLLGTIYESQTKMKLAEEHYRKALSIKHDFVPAANNLAYILADSNRNLDEALALAKIAKEKAPTAPNIMDTLGWAYYKKGFYESAISELRDCLEQLPDNAIVNYHLGLAYNKTGDLVKAKIQFKKALKLDEKFPGADDAKNILSKM